MTRKFRGVEYKISVVNKKNDGEVKVTVKAGAKVNGTCVVPNKGVKTVKVNVVVE